ncbi:uncharacterized protein LOC127900572 [Citrus sinensis]|uniref:uncharacterized protein LOC127900572 n=1 Tax=Citrus sinensis TaxID=2711 RepID=UPI00227783CF|nr:uncharacterized protein LOC127900572 [Citrus sinensis]
MGLQRRLGIYVGFYSPSIIRYLEPLTGDLFTARFADCHFDEQIFPSLGGEKTKVNERREITWHASSLSHLDSHTNKSELKVKRIIHLQNIVNQIPNAFTDLRKITESYIPGKNALSRVEIPEGQHDKTNESKVRLKHGRPISSKDKIPQKRKRQEKLENEISTPEESLPANQITEIDQSKSIRPIDSEEDLPTTEKVSISPKEKQNDEIMIGFVGIEKSWD